VNLYGFAMGMDVADCFSALDLAILGQCIKGLDYVVKSFCNISSMYSR
jgi:hypothetical protein